MRRKLMQTSTLTKGWPAQVIEEYALRLLREDLARDLNLPSFEEFREQPQGQMF